MSGGNHPSSHGASSKPGVLVAIAGMFSNTIGSAMECVTKAADTAIRGNIPGGKEGGAVGHGHDDHH